MAEPGCRLGTQQVSLVPTASNETKSGSYAPDFRRTLVSSSVPMAKSACADSYGKTISFAANGMITFIVSPVDQPSGKTYLVPMTASPQTWKPHQPF